MAGQHESIPSIDDLYPDDARTRVWWTCRSCGCEFDYNAHRTEYGPDADAAEYHPEKNPFPSNAHDRTYAVILCETCWSSMTVEERMMEYEKVFHGHPVWGWIKKAVEEGR